MRTRQTMPCWGMERSGEWTKLLLHFTGGNASLWVRHYYYCTSKWRFDIAENTHTQRKQSDSNYLLHPPPLLNNVGVEWKSITAVLQWWGEQGGGGRRHHGWGCHPLPSPDEPRFDFIAGRPRCHGEHPQPLVQLSGPRDGWWDSMY